MLRADRLLELADVIEKMPWAKDRQSGGECGFNMEVWNEDFPCGTVSCIGGTAQIHFGLKHETEVYAFLSDLGEKVTEHIVEEEANGYRSARYVRSDDYSSLLSLFYPPPHGWSADPQEAAQVIRHLATTGQVDWDRMHNSEEEPEPNTGDDFGRLADDGGPNAE